MVGANTTDAENTLAAATGSMQEHIRLGFYQQDVYFIMGADGLWYAVAYGDPSLTFQVDIE
jgi:hypothetical protein